MPQSPTLLLELLSRRYPTLHHAIAHLSAVRAQATLPRGAVHVFSDVHGKNEKLRHIINNGSGRLVPIIAELDDDLERVPKMQRIEAFPEPRTRGEVPETGVLIAQQP